MSIYICGDTHGLLDFKKLKNLAIQENLTYDDYVIICGDAGIVWHDFTTSENIQEYENLNTNILYADGNHENYDKLNAYPITKWQGGKIHKISEHIYHLMRGQIFTINNKKFLIIGGAESHDKCNRIEHKSWWSDESISYQDIVESLKNASQYNNDVDYIISHCPPTDCLNKLEKVLTQCGESIPYYLQRKMQNLQSNQLLQEIVEKIKFKKWFCGHLHCDEDLGKYEILYETIVKIT